MILCVVYFIISNSLYMLSPIIVRCQNHVGFATLYAPFFNYSNNTSSRGKKAKTKTCKPQKLEISNKRTHICPCTACI